MNVQFLTGSLVAPVGLPSYAGQSFEWMNAGAVVKLSGEEGMVNSFSTGYVIPSVAQFAGDEFETVINFTLVNVGPPIYYGYLGVSQQSSGYVAFTQGYIIQ